MTDGVADVPALADEIGDDTAMVYAESPTVRGVIEERLGAIGDVADDRARCSVSARTRCAALLERPASVGADVVVGDAASLGTGTAYGIGLGTPHRDGLRQVPGRLVGASEDAADRRAYTLTLQTREQHIRKERATSNICTNQAWVALRAAMHAAYLGPDGLTDLQKTVSPALGPGRPPRRYCRGDGPDSRPPPLPGDLAQRTHPEAPSLPTSQPMASRPRGRLHLCSCV